MTFLKVLFLLLFFYVSVWSIGNFKIDENEYTTLQYSDDLENRPTASGDNNLTNSKATNDSDDFDSLDQNGHAKKQKNKYLTTTRMDEDSSLSMKTVSYGTHTVQKDFIYVNNTDLRHDVTTDIIVFGIFTSPNDGNTKNIAAKATTNEFYKTDVMISTTVKMVDPSDRYPTSTVLTTGGIHDLTLSPTSQKAVPIDPCYDKGTCLFGDAMQHRYCRCDVACAEYKDCCIDANSEKNQSKETQTISRFHGYLECYRHTNVDRYYGGFFVVGSCPVEFQNDEIRQKCHNNDIVIRHGPCVVNNKTLVFKNRFCALCHGVTSFEAFEIHFYSRDLKLDDMITKFANRTRNEKLAILIEEERVEYVLKAPKSASIRPCMSSLIVSPKDTCQNAPINPVVWIKGIRQPYIYRNRACVPPEDELVLICIGSTYNSLGNLGDFGYSLGLFPMTIMFSFNSNDDNDDSNKISREDKDGCAKWNPQIAESEICDDMEVYTNATFDMLPFYVMTSSELTDRDVEMVGMVLSWSMESLNMSEIGLSKLHVADNSTKWYVKMTKVKIFKTVFVEELARIRTQWEKRTWKAMFYDEKTKISVNVEKYDLNLTINNDEGYTKEIKSPWRRAVSLEDQLRIIFNVSSFEGLQNVFCNDLTLKITRKITGDIHVNIISCQNDEIDTFVVNQDKIDASTIITYTTFTVSTISLLCLIIINRHARVTTGIAGANLENVSVSLSISNIAFMAGIGNADITGLCYVISIFLHYCWLCSFCFMSISVLFIVRNLTKMRSKFRKSNDSTKQRGVVTVVGLLVPLLFVIPAVVIDNLGPEAVSPGYGQSVCFPNKFPGNMIFFSGPVMLSLLISFIGLLRLVINISKYKIDVGSVSSSSSFTMATVFIRILALSNLFWLAGICASLTQLDWLKHVFTLTCGLHGFFITIASLTTRRFRKLVATRLRSSDNSKTSDT